MKKVLFFITSPSAGGAETYLLRFLRFAQGIEATVICKKSFDGELASQYQEVCDLTFVGKLGLYNPLPYYNLCRYLKNNCHDVVCDFTGNFSAWDLLCAKLVNLPIRIAFYRESRNQFKPSPFKKVYANLMTLLTHKYATKILSNSVEALNHFYPNWVKEQYKYRVIYNGLDMLQLSRKSRLDMRELLQIPHNAFVVCHSGRYTPAKNHHTIIKCAIKLCKKHNNIVFILMGRGVKEAYGDVIISMGLSDQIRILGYRDDVLDILKSADIFYFPSLNEGQPNALIEAMASDLPFVASDIPTIRETVPQQSQNTLVNPLDIEQNVGAIEDLYQKRHSLVERSVGQWARNYYESHKLFNHFLKELI